MLLCLDALFVAVILALVRVLPWLFVPLAFSILVVMALVTTFMTSPPLNLLPEGGLLVIGV